MYRSFFSPLYGYGINRQVMPSFYRTFRSVVPQARVSSFSIEKIISRTQRSINTINQIIPLYKQVKPIYNQGKNMIKTVATFINKSFGQNVTSSSSSSKNETSSSFRFNDEKNNPFFR